MKYFFLSLILLICSGMPELRANQDALPKTLRYKLDLRIDYDAEKLFGVCEIIISNGTDQPLNNVPILLYRLLKVTSVKTGNGEPLNYKQTVVSIAGWEKLQVNFTEIALSQDLHPGKQQVIVIAYEGYLLGYVNEGWRYVKDHISRDFTIIRTDGFDYPVIGYPEEQNMMAVIKEQYDYAVDITLPEGVIPVSGAELLSKRVSGLETTYTFRSRKPSWRLDIAIGNYRTFESNKNRIYYFKEDSASAVQMIRSLEECVNLLTDWLGPIKDFMGFSILEIPEGYSSQQDVTSFNITADNFKKPGDMLSIYHEISHLWNVKSLDPQPCRFESEGFARFMECLISEKLDKKDNVVSRTAQRCIGIVRKNFAENPEFQDIAMKDFGISNMTGYSYTLGMVVFSLFYDLTGKDKFNQIIRSFYSAYTSEGATLDDFISHCKKSAPFDADRFFGDWIYTSAGVRLIIDGKSFDDLREHYNSK